MFFDLQGDQAYLSVEIKRVHQVLPIGGRAFAQWLSFSYYNATLETSKVGKSVSDSAIKQACITLAGIAQYSSRHQRVHLRMAQGEGGHYIFIGDPSQRVIEVKPTGWQLLTRSPMPFWMPPSMQALPIPRAGGKLDLLWQYVNIPEPSRPLVLAWLLESFRANTPKPILSLVGVQGSAKSSAQNKLRQVLDNNAANLRAAPKSIEDVYVGAASNWLASFENVSYLSSQLQDALCTFATGAGSSTRKLYSDAEENIIAYKRPVIINSIPMVITAQDLADRVICIEMPVVERYVEEAVLEPEWERAKPEIFGGLLDLFVLTLAQLPQVVLKKPPRMADFTRLGEAMMQSQGHAPGSFQSLYQSNRQGSIDNALAASSVAQAISALVYAQTGDTQQVFYGTLQTLLARLAVYRRDFEDWPKSAKALSDALRRQLPALKSIGIDVLLTGKVERVGGERGYTVKIRKNARYSSLNTEIEPDQAKFVVFDHQDKERF